MQPTYITSRAVLPSFDYVSEPGLHDEPEKTIDIQHAKSILGSLVIVDRVEQIRAFFEQNRSDSLRHALSQGYTSLHIAADRPNAKTLSVLLEYLPGAINAVNYKGNTPLLVATKNGHEEVIRTLLIANTSAEARLQRRRSSFWPPFSSTVDAVKAFLRAESYSPGVSVNQADIEAADHDGNTPVMVAIQHGNFAAARLLIDMGASVYASNRHGTTPAMLTAAAGDVGILELLAASGADLNAKDQHGHSALIYATCTPKDECDDKTIRQMVAALMRWGANGA